ncbi:hypothetical protein J3459_017331 [Metarhizium acridum]|uniref:uncharacterized protein n=1 Tax=Metarhizium acridum TaxID=92637 RepID=UPI001C6C8742|nr:hypothetical protein J3459_017331 [Metarhizium acridum]KAG8413965.1 hypothetical protein J3458_011622 [Metarhizium acridum]
MASFANKSSSNEWPARGLNKKPARGLNKKPARGLNKKPARGLNKKPARGLNKKPARGLNKKPARPDRTTAQNTKRINVEWRAQNEDVVKDLAEKACKLAMVKLGTFGTEKLHENKVHDTIKLLDQVSNLDFWSEPSFKLMLPALYICQARDQKAYDYIMWFAHNEYQYDIPTLGRPATGGGTIKAILIILFLNPPTSRGP